MNRYAPKKKTYVYRVAWRDPRFDGEQVRWRATQSGAKARYYEAAKDAKADGVKLISRSLDKIEIPADPNNLVNWLNENATFLPEVIQ